MNQPSIASLDEKINSFIVSQDKHNDKVTNAIDKMSETISNLNTVHVEINHLSAEIAGVKSSVNDVIKDVKEMNDKVITNSIQADEYKHIKKIFITFVVVAILGGGYMTKTNTDNSAKQAQAMAEIGLAIKETINKGK